MAPKQAAQRQQPQQPAVPAVSEADLEQLFEKLDRFVKNDQHKKALKAAEDILAVVPSDEDAQLAKVAALMQLGNWDQAHAAITKSAALASKLRFELAYCLYKLGKSEEGLEQLAPLLDDGDSSPAKELAAQLQYRLGRFQQCIQLYNSQFQQHKADHLELKCNVLAAYVAAGLSKELPSLMSAMKVTSDNSFEVGYNKACALVDAGQWGAAETELRRALKRGRETLFQEDEECTEEEVEEELSPLTVQLAYVLGRLGREAEAQELYDTVLRSKSELADEPTRAVAINNSFADSGRIDALAAHRKTVAGAAKKLESLLQDPSKPGQLTFTSSLEARLSPSQKQLLSLNRALVYFLSGRAEGARQMLASLQAQQQQQQLGAGGSKEEGAPAHLLPLLQASLLHSDGKAAEADALLEQFAASHPASAFEPQLARAQLALEAGNVPKALAALAAAQAAQQPPGAPRGALVATQVALLTQVGDSEGAEAVLGKALAALKKDANSEPEALAWCLEALLQLQLRLGKQQEALATFAQLQATGTQSATSAALRAKLLWSLSGAGAASTSAAPSWPAGVTKGLPSLAHEVRALNVDALENSIASARPEPKIRLAADEAEEGAETGTDAEGKGAMDVDGAPAKQRGPRKRNKKRKRYPKGYDAALPGGGLPPPDPERWLPKWQRTDNKKKKLKSAARDKGAVKGSQGAGKVDESLDVSKSKAGSSSQAAGKKGPQLPPPPAKKKGKK